MGSNYTNFSIYTCRRRSISSTSVIDFCFVLLIIMTKLFSDISSDSSSCSIDGKTQQYGGSVKSSPSPPKTINSTTFGKLCKTPLNDYHHSRMTNIVLVPQTDNQPRYQRRYRRNSSSSNSSSHRQGLIFIKNYFINVIYYRGVTLFNNNF